MLKILSWNVNGVRAAQRKGFLDWLQKESPDIIGIQETKALPEQLDDALLNPPGYEAYWNSAERKGYSGVAVFTKIKPIEVKRGFSVKPFDTEGRMIALEFKNFVFINIYFPNGKAKEERLKYKLDFYDETLKYAEKLRKKGKQLIICGDYNTAHNAIDLKRPKENEKYSGFLPIERDWMDKFVGKGYLDTFRLFNKEPDNYTWWDMQTRARDRNVGWRIDYHFITEDLKPRLKDAFIMPEVMGSDHCPVGILLKP